MSAPPTMPAMVSRLPRFGFRPKPATPSSATQTGPVTVAGAATRLTNGFYHHPGPAGVHGGLTAAAAKQNGFPRGPAAISVRWREAPPAEDERRRGKGVTAGQNRPGTDAQQHPSQKTTAVGLGSRALPAPKGGSVGSKPSQTPNGTSGPKSTAGTDGSPKQPHGFVRSAGSRPGSGPGSRSGSPMQKKPPANRCRSSDSLDPVLAVQLVESDRIRSRSLTQVRRLPPPPHPAPLPPLLPPPHQHPVLRHEPSSLPVGSAHRPLREASR